MGASGYMIGHIGEICVFDVNNKKKKKKTNKQNKKKTISGKHNQLKNHNRDVIIYMRETRREKGGR